MTGPWTMVGPYRVRWERYGFSWVVPVVYERFRFFGRRLWWVQASNPQVDGQCIKDIKAAQMSSAEILAEYAEAVRQFEQRRRAWAQIENATHQLSGKEIGRSSR